MLCCVCWTIYLAMSILSITAIIARGGKGIQELYLHCYKLCWAESSDVRLSFLVSFYLKLKQLNHV